MISWKILYPNQIFHDGPIVWLKRGLILFQRRCLSIGLEVISLASELLNIRKKWNILTSQIVTLFGGIKPSSKRKMSNLHLRSWTEQRIKSKSVTKILIAIWYLMWIWERNSTGNIRWPEEGIILSLWHWWLNNLWFQDTLLELNWL